jgi:hypothetical protein
MNTPLASPSQIRSGAGGNARNTQARKGRALELTNNRNGITVRMLNRNNPASARHTRALYWSTPVSDRGGSCRFPRHIPVGAAG